MANTASAKKAVRKIERRTRVNRVRRSKMRTQIRKAEEALGAGGADVGDVVRVTESMIMKAAQKGILHRNTAARKVARLAMKAKYLKAAAAS